MGAAGVVDFQKFVEGGGLLITLGTSSAFPPEYGIAPTIDTSTPAGKFYAPGPIVDADILRPDNPIFYGYSAKPCPCAMPTVRSSALLRRWIRTMC